MDSVAILLLVSANCVLSVSGLPYGFFFLLRIPDNYGDGNCTQCSVLSDLSDFISETGASDRLLGELYEVHLSWQLQGTELCTKSALFQLLSHNMCFLHMCGNASLDSDIYNFNCCHDCAVYTYDKTAHGN